MFHNPEESWAVFELIDSFTDGFGSWKYLPKDAHLLAQDEMMMEDVQTEYEFRVNNPNAGNNAAG